MEKVLSSQQKFYTEIVSTLSKEAKSRFLVKINEQGIIYASDPEHLTVAVAPLVKSKTTKESAVLDIALVLVTPGYDEKRNLLPSGVYLLQCLGRTSRLVDENGVTITKGRTHTIQRRITIGDVVITIGGCKLCIYWDDPPSPLGGACHCHCFEYCEVVVA